MMLRSFFLAYRNYRLGVAGHKSAVAVAALGEAPAEFANAPGAAPVEPLLASQ